VTPYLLGLTVGVASLGWAALSLDENNDPCGILAAGVRVFPTGTTGDIESGRDASRNKQRRESRLRRVHLRRRRQRLDRLYAALVRHGLARPSARRERHIVLEQDKADPYELRTRALDEKLAPYELGRVLYHLTQRRGFRSLKRRPKEDDEQLNIIEQGIQELNEAIQASGARTLGEYLFRQPSKRRRWTSRRMYQDELAAIMRVQRLPDEVQAELTQLVFADKIASPAAFRVGRCELEPSKRRLALAHPLAQEFRLLQKVNDLRLVDDVGMEELPLTPQQRQIVLAELANGDATFAALRKAIKVGRTVRFNFEAGKAKSITGNRTRESLCAAVPTIQDGVLADVVEALLGIVEEKGLVKRLGALGFTAEEALRLAEAKLEGSYLRLSLRAVAKLVPLMRQGISYATAVKQLYPHKSPSGPTRDKLPLLTDFCPYLAQPLARRALSEMRKVVHAVLDKYGKPVRIRLELHRHLSMGPKARQAAAERSSFRHHAKKLAAERLAKELGVIDPSPSQIERILLGNECGWHDPFSGRVIPFRALCGGEPTYQALHLVPFAMSLDDDMNNKTLAHVNLITARGPYKLLSEMNLSDEVRRSAPSQKAAQGLASGDHQSSDHWLFGLKR
jgi:CRISPR-associated endonuclease Csn1